MNGTNRIAEDADVLKMVKTATLGLIGDNVKVIKASFLICRVDDQAARLGLGWVTWSEIQEAAEKIGCVIVGAGTMSDPDVNLPERVSL